MSSNEKIRKEVHKITLDYPPKENCEDLDQFLLNFPHKNIENVVIDEETTKLLNKHTKIEYFLYSNYSFGISEIAFKTTREFTLGSFMLTSKEFCKLVMITKRTEHLFFQNCQILTDSECNFEKMDRCKIQSISIYNRRSSEHKDAISNRFINILDGVLCCFSLIQSLKKFELRICSKSVAKILNKKVEEMLGFRSKEHKIKFIFNSLL